MLQATAEEREEVCVRYYSKMNFDRLVQKALETLSMEHLSTTWRESLMNLRPPVTCNMSIERTKVIIKKFFAFNGYSLHKIKTIESILDKTSGKVNTTILKGPH